MKNIKVGLVSLGCSKNKCDAEVMLKKLSDAGYQLTMDPAEAEVIIVNTCGFITEAKQEAVDTILEMAEYKKNGSCRSLIVSGCLTGRYPDELYEELPEVNAILGISQYPDIVSIVGRTLQGARIKNAAIDETLSGLPDRILTTPPWMAYLKIAEGCDNCCSFCAIPMIRGRFRSRTVEDLTGETRLLASQGVKELILIAQDTTRYGEDIYGKPCLPRLLRAVSAVDGIEWVRVLYCYPELVDDELLRTMAEEPKICDYLDIPLQHAEDRMLEAMNRRSDAAQIRDMSDRIRRMPVPFALRTTMITGFPGETEADFEVLKKFIAEHPFDHLGAFTYSPEDGTPAAEMEDQVEEETKKRRLDELMTLQQGISAERLRRYVGQTLEVLTEDVLPGGYYLGRTRYQAPEIDGVTRFKGQKGILPGTFVRVRITDTAEYDLEGVQTDVTGE